ncbi:MAG: crotonase/enoyl-CoA hydratase family protein [Rhizomicrobium sp.]
MTSPFVLYEKAGRVVTLTLNRPDTRNALASHEDCRSLVEALETANADTEVSVLILTGAGAAFSAGGDLKAMKMRNGIGPLATPADTRANYKKGVQRVALALTDLEIATVAAMNGHAIGLGLDLACFCDIRICAENAKLASSFVKLGLVPGDGGAWILPRVVGYARAAEMILTGDTFSANEALTYGLINKITPADEVLRTAKDFAERIAVNPPRSVRLAKRLLREGQHARLADMLELSAAFQALAHETADHQEAVDAFLEKRKPAVTGA